jgi:hypothetical protein
MSFPRSRLAVLLGAFLSVASCVLPGVARAKGDANGSLGTGGVVRGDISREVGETDHITVDLAEGGVLVLRLGASFEPLVVVTGPDGTALDVGQPVRRRLRVGDRVVPASGRYEIAVSSRDGSQGTYALSVSERWARRVPVSGTGASVIDVGMPAGGKLGCVLRRAVGAAGAPEILQVEDPGGADLLAAAIEPRGAVAKLAPTPTASAGVYHVVVGVTGTGGPWNGQVLRVLPPAKRTHLTLTNGLDAISFADDGVRRIFQTRCASCHGWAASYAGVRGYVDQALGRMRSGSMPPSGPLASQDIALVAAWAKTGRKP